MTRVLRFRRFGGRAVFVLAALGWAVSAAFGQTDLGGQRVGTASGAFLKIGLDARAAGLGGSYDAVAAGPSAVFYNPAGILNGPASPALTAGAVQWPGDLTISSAALSWSIPSVAGRFAFGLAYLGTSFEETTEYDPTGTGRSTDYSDFLVSGTFAREFTDRLDIGVTAKYFREDLGSNVGGPVVNAILFDAGSIYTLGYRNSRLSVTVSQFGADLTPGGSFDSNVLHTSVAYTGFTPPTQFQLGFSIDPWSSGQSRLTSVSHIVHSADNAEGFRSGLEYWYRELVALRSGYDFQTNAMGFSAGVGFRLSLGGRSGTVDYAYTDGGHLGAIHRIGIGFSI